MRIFRNKFLVKLIASLCIFLTLLNFGLATKVYAENKVLGGVLLIPVMRLLSGIGDAIMDILHLALLEQQESLIRLDGSADNWWNRHGANVLGWLAAIVVVTVVVLSVIPSGGASVAAGAGILAKIGAACFVVKTAAVAVGAGAVSGFLVARVVDSAMMDDDIYLPVYRVTPEEIFANEIPLFDVNFFNPMADKEMGEEVISEERTEKVSAPRTNYSVFEEEDRKYSKFNYAGKDFKVDITGTGNTAYDGAMGNTAPAKEWNAVVEYFEEKGATYVGETSLKYVLELDGGKYTIEKITNRSGTSYSYEGYKLKVIPAETRTIVLSSTASQLKEVVSSWYFILRNLALLVLMLLLIYSGIKIVTGSTAGEKAKYKERLMDWLVAMCLVFIMHYIMVFAVELNEKIIELIDSPSEEQAVVKEIVLSNQNHLNAATKDSRLSEYIIDQSGYKVLEWGTDLMGGMRIEQQLIYEGTANWVGYVLCYIVLVIYTLIFSWTYLKRVLYMAFLTMIAPLVAMTYPIDKITDGKAQAFNSWIKEYIFNLLIQPLHLLLYMVLVGSAYELAGKNALYAIVAIGFMTPAEKLLRKFFGFEKAQTPGLLGGAAGTALAMTGMKSLMKFGKRGKGGGSSREESDSQDNSKIKYSSSSGINPKGVVASHTQETKTENTQTEEKEETVSTEEAKKIKQNVIPHAVPENTISETTNPETTNSKTTTVKEPIKERKTKKQNRFVRGMKSLGTGIGAYRRGLGNKLYKRINRGRPIRAMARGLAGLTGATAFGMAGLALGIASGDPSKAFQYTTAGAVGGMGLGKGLAGGAVDALTVDSQKIKDEMEMEYYGNDYKNIKLEQEKNKMQHDDEYINYIRATLGVSRGEAERILEKTGGECFDSGIRNIEDIAAIEQMSNDITEEELTQWIEENKKQLSELDENIKAEKIAEVKGQMEEEARRHAIAMKKFSDRTPDLTKLGDKKVESYRSQFKNEMEKEFYNRLISQGKTEEEARKKSEELAKEAADSIISGIIKFYDTKSDILKA